LLSIVIATGPFSLAILVSFGAIYGGLCLVFSDLIMISSQVYRVAAINALFLGFIAAIFWNYSINKLISES
jgi:hypothetical protein